MTAQLLGEGISYHTGFIKGTGMGLDLRLVWGAGGGSKVAGKFLVDGGGGRLGVLKKAWGFENPWEKIAGFIPSPAGDLPETREN
jgi:hypothetical protein